MLSAARLFRAGALEHASMEAAVFERAYREHARGVFHVALQVLADPTQAQDVVQDVFLGLWRESCRFDPERGPLGRDPRLVARGGGPGLWRGGHVGGRA